MANTSTLLSQGDGKNQMNEDNDSRTSLALAAVSTEQNTTTIEQIPITTRNKEKNDTSYIIPPFVDLVLPIPGVLPGLEYVVGLHHIFVKPFIDYEYGTTGISSYIRHDVVNISGRRLFLANEISSCPNRWWWMRKNHTFEVNIYNNFGILVISLKRPFTFSLCWWGGNCCGNKLTIHHGNGQLLGSIKQRINPFTPTFDVFDEYDHKNFKICGPKGFLWRCCLLRRQFDFHIFLSIDKKTSPIGKITKQWNGRNPNMYSHIDPGVEFPVELNSIQKVLLLSGLFLVEFQFFESHKRNSNWRTRTQSCTVFTLFLCLSILFGMLIIFYAYAALEIIIP